MRDRRAGVHMLFENARVHLTNSSIFKQHVYACPPVPHRRWTHPVGRCGLNRGLCRTGAAYFRGFAQRPGTHSPKRTSPSHSLHTGNRHGARAYVARYAE